MGAVQILLSLPIGLLVGTFLTMVIDRVPDDLPWRDVLGVAERYLGTLHSGPADWDPVSSRRDLFAKFSDEADHVRADDPWQFANFLDS